MLGETYATNPKLDVPEWAWTMVRIWRLTKGGHAAGMGFAMTLPGQPLEAGGVLEQSPYMTDCMAIMDGAERAFKSEIGGDGDGNV